MTANAAAAVRLLAAELIEEHHEPEVKRITLRLDRDAEILNRKGVTLRNLIELAYKAEFDHGDAPEGCEYFAMGPHSWAVAKNKYDAIAAAVTGASYWNESQKIIQLLIAPDCDYNVSNFNGAPSWNSDDEPAGFKAYEQEHGKSKWVCYHADGTEFTEAEVAAAKAAD